MLNVEKVEKNYTGIIVHNCQNWTKDQLKKILTRIHDSCKVIIIGHTGQIDLDSQKDSGFQFVINHFKDKSYVNVYFNCQFSRGSRN